jgi:hypothetical protein
LAGKLLGRSRLRLEDNIKKGFMEMVCDSGVKDGSVSGSCIMGHIDFSSV